MNRLAILFVLLIVGVPACAEDKKEKAAKGDTDPAKMVAFKKLDFEKAVTAAKADKKVVMIDFNATWCGPCKQLDKDTFSNEKVQKMLSEKTVAIKVDVDDNEKLAAKYKINSIPCMVFINGDGKEVGRLVGYKTVEEFLDEAKPLVK